MYKPTKWKNRIYDEQGNIIEDGTGLWAEYLNNMENGIVDAYKQFDNMVEKEEGKTLTSNDFTDFYRSEVDKIPEYLKLKVDKEDGKGLSSNDFKDIYKDKLDNLGSVLLSKVDKEDGKGLSSNDFTAAYIKMIENTKEELGNKNIPNGLLQLDSRGLIPGEYIPGDFKENYIVSSIEDVSKIENPFAGMRVTVLDEIQGTWTEFMYNGTEFIKLTSSTDLDISLVWEDILNKPNQFPPEYHTHKEEDILGLDKYTRQEVDEKLDTKALKEHTHSTKDITDLSVYTKKEVDSKLDSKAENIHVHTERDISDLDKYTKAQVDSKLKDKSDSNHTHTEKDISDLDKYTKEETDRLLAPKLTEESNIVQTVNNSIGWEKNILFKADERFTVIEHNTKVGKGNYKTFFDGGLDPISIPNVNEDNPYIIEIAGLPEVNTQGKGTIGFVSRFRYPRDFKIEWYNSRANKWELLVEKTNWNKAYFYSDNFTGSASKIKLTFTKVQAEDFLQLAQIVFINPEASILYDYLLAKNDDLKEVEADIGILKDSVANLDKSDHSHSNKDILDKLVYLGSRDKIDLDQIYTHEHSWSSITSKPTEFNPSSHSHEEYALKTALEELERVVNSLDIPDIDVAELNQIITDLANKIPESGMDLNVRQGSNKKVTENLEELETNKVNKKDIPSNLDIVNKLVDLGNNSQIDLDQIYSHKHNYSEIQNKPNIPSKITDLVDNVNLVTSDTSRKVMVSESSPINPKEGDIWIRI